MVSQPSDAAKVLNAQVKERTITIPIGHFSPQEKRTAKAIADRMRQIRGTFLTNRGVLHCLIKTSGTAAERVMSTLCERILEAVPAQRLAPQTNQDNGKAPTVRKSRDSRSSRRRPLIA